MKQIILHLVLAYCVFNQYSYAQGNLHATYTSGDISTSLNVFESACYNTNTLAITLPNVATEYVITNVALEYEMTALGGGFMSDQRSILHFLNTNTPEASEAIGVGNTAGTMAYSRNVAIANGTYQAGTILTFQLRARRTFDGSAGCNTLTNKVDHKTWKITVSYAIAGKIGINNNTPTAGIDIAGGVRIRPVYLPVINNLLTIPDNVTNVNIENAGSIGPFTIAINTLHEGQIMIFDNNSGYTGTLPGAAVVPLGMSQFILTDGEWKLMNTGNSVSSSSGWSLTGNPSTNPSSNSLGTTDNQPLVFKTNNAERMRLQSSPLKNELKFKNGLEDTTKLVFSRTDGTDFVDFAMSSNPASSGLGLNFSSNSNVPLFAHKNLLQLDAFSGWAGIGTDNLYGKLTIGGNRTIGSNLPTLSIVDSSTTNTSGSILEFSNLDRSNTYRLQSHLGSNPDGSDSYLTFSRHGFWLMRLRGDGNLGIGNGGINPSLAPLVVRKKIGNSHAIFGDDVAGVSIESAFPGIHFNSYFNASRKTLVNGFTTGMEMDPSVGSLLFYTSPTSTLAGATASVFSRMVVDKNGNVGINSGSSASHKLQVVGTARSTQFLVNETTTNQTGASVSLTGTGNIGIFSTAETGIWANGTQAGLLATSSVTGYGIHSTGRVKLENHMEVYDAKIKLFKGSTQTVELNPSETGTTGAELKLMNASGVVTIEMDADFNDGDGRVITSELQINGGSDFAENFDIANKDIQILPGMVLSIDDEIEGKLKLSQGKNDKKVVGVVSGANGIKPGMLMGQKESIADGEYPLALAGRVYVLTTDEYEITAGDFLTTSNKAGYATKAINIAESQGAIIGKAMGRRDPKTGYVLVLVNLQ